eukprot:COSAG01_NODE_3017_length_6713_cov_20.316752_1_plen_125_part_00
MSTALLVATHATAKAPPAVVPPPKFSARVNTCVDDSGHNVSCGPTTSQRCQAHEIWPRPRYHVMDFYCAENDPNGPYISQDGVYHLFFQDHLGLPNRNSSWPGASLSWGTILHVFSETPYLLDL